MRKLTTAPMVQIFQSAEDRIPPLPGALMLTLPLMFSVTQAGTPQDWSGALPDGTHLRHLRQFADTPADIPTSPASPPPPATARPDVTVYGYHAYWTGSPLDLDFTRLTHVAVFNVDLNSDGTLSDQAHWTDVAADLVPLAHSHGVKVHLCMTSFYDSTTNAVLESPSKRGVAIAALKSLVDAYGADGVNVDIEGLDLSQKQNMVDFIQELSAEVDEVVIATPAIDWLGAFDYDELANASDGLFIMGYGYHWSGGDPGPIAPLFGGGIWSDYSLEWTVEDYLATGAPADKIILGLPLYGREWPTSGSSVPGSATSDGVAVLMSSAISQAGNNASWDTTTHTPYVLESSSQLWYDNNDSIQDRTAWAVESGLQGIGFWALQYEGGDPDFWAMISEETDRGIDGDTGGGGDTGSDGNNAAPIALAGLPLMAYPGDTVLLNGTPSYDPEGSELSYTWSQASGPPVTLSGELTAEPRFTADVPGVHTFALVVSDGVQNSALDTVDIVVADPGAGRRYSGCSAVGAGGGLWLGLLGLLLRRKRT